ncbi:MAG: HEPN domain-containing protein [Planctomycetes bacterium]|nr:HEPN domain-containing protein [Planctomycetota bacterium]
MSEKWDDIAKDSLAAAGACLRNGNWRSATSRSYYAIFAKVTGELCTNGMLPPKGRENWSHRDLPQMVLNHLMQKNGARVKDVSRMLKVAYKDRINADYVTMQATDRQTAIRAVSNASSVLRRLEA